MPTMKRLSQALQDTDLPDQLKILPLQAYWFFVGSMGLAHDANKNGMHANALALTRLCIETISIMELGMCRHSSREGMLLRWEKGKASPGELRRWLARNVWPSYGFGLWSESWETYMRCLAKAVQPYAHYTEQLSQWQSAIRLVDSDKTAIVEFGPKAYDPQKATRITLYHAILTYTLARIFNATTQVHDANFEALSNRFGKALGNSKYLDGHQTNWEQQFWAMMWSRNGNTILE